MRIAAGLLPGRTYILDDYSVIHVLALEGDAVRFRTRGQPRPWWRRRRVVERTAPVAGIRLRLRAEIDGSFFPDVAVPGPTAFRHPPDQEAGLRRHLAERASHRPFVA